MRSDRNYKLYLDDIKDCLEKIKNYTDNISEEEFRADVKLQDAVMRRLEIIGEAVKNIPKSVRDINSEIPWVSLSNFKNVLIHSYFEVSLNRIWRIVKKDIPAIMEKMKDIKLL